MTSGAAVRAPQYQFVSMPNIYHEQIVERRPLKSPPVWNSHAAPLSDVLRGRSTPLMVRDVGRRDNKHRDLYVHSVSPASLVVAEGLAADRRCGLVPTGRRYLIPVEHGGWFELLSQDGHAATPITAVQQLMKLAPERCLVRRTIVATSGDDAARRSCKISAGETLSVEGVQVNSSCLRCRVDSTGQSVILAADQRGLFSPVAAPTNVAGVHRMRSVVDKFRFPVIVRLISRNCESSSTSNSGLSTVAYRLIAMQTDSAAYVVPLWLIGAPSDVTRRSMLSLPISAQVSSVLDGVMSVGDTRTAVWETWTELDWDELRRRCDGLVKSGAVTAELTRLFAAHNVDDRQRPGPVTSPVPLSQHRQSDDFRLLREIDHIYEAIKARDVAGRKNCARVTTAAQIPRRYRSVRQTAARDSTGHVTALNGGNVKTRTRSPARRSNTFDSSYNKPAHHHHRHSNAVDPISCVESQQQCHINGRQVSPSPTRLRRVTSHITPSAVRRHSPLLAQHRLKVHSQEGQDNDPVYEQLTSLDQAVHTATEPSVVQDGGQYVALADSPADNLRQVIKDKSSSEQTHQSTPVERPRRWSVAVGSDHSLVACQLPIFDDATTKVDVPAPPAVTRPLDSVSTANKSVPRSLSSGPVTSSSSDDVSATDRKSLSALSAAPSTLNRSLCRADTSAQPSSSRSTYLVTNGMQGGPSRNADDVAVTSQTPARDVITVEYAGGKVTHF